MTLRPTPWATSGGADGKGGAHNSVELARVGMYAATKGKTGIIEPNDLKVSQLPVPAGAVRVTKGTGVIKSTYPNVFGQSYAVQEDGYTDVPVSATGSGGTVTKYVYIRIDDSQYYGQAPADIENGPYNGYYVTTSLPTIQPYLLLAMIKQPASTGTILNTMITDLRVVANPRKESELRTYALITGDTQDLNSTGDYPTGQTWPVAVEDAWGEIDIPDWAVYVKVVMMWTGVRTSGANVYGGIWVQIGPTANENNIKTQYVEYNSANPSDVTRDVLVAADIKKIPTALRGTSQKFYPRGNRRSSGSGRLRLDGASSMVLQLEFMERAD